MFFRKASNRSLQSQVTYLVKKEDSSIMVAVYARLRTLVRYSTVCRMIFYQSDQALFIVQHYSYFLGSNRVRGN